MDCLTDTTKWNNFLSDHKMLWLEVITAQLRKQLSREITTEVVLQLSSVNSKTFLH